MEIDPKNARMIQKRLEDIREADSIEKYYQDYLYTEDLPKIWGARSTVKVSAKTKSKQPSLFG
ncbi:MAG: hypothetical protein QM730_09365 [Anaerolineales bacterium]